jgi:3',5'-cyclic AMP phosphodiesterase CpdA
MRPRTRIRAALPSAAALWLLAGAAAGGCTSRAPEPAESALKAAPAPVDRTPAGRAAVPRRIVLNPAATPAVRQPVTWRTAGPVTRARAEIVAASGRVDFAAAARALPARSTPVALDDGRSVIHHAVVFDSLEPDRLYAYRVGADEAWSEWSHFRSAPAAAAPLRFVYLGDPQDELKSSCTRLFRAAYQQAPRAAFWLVAGDLVDQGTRDAEWAELFYALGPVPRQLPLVPVPGNHEYPDPRRVSGTDYRLTPLWRPHFTLPANGPAGLEETVYHIDYPLLRLVVLNGNERLEQQARWLDALLADGSQPWTIVAIHQPLYSTGKRRDSRTRQRLLVPIFDRHGVDLVLQGHDHTYGRSAPLRAGKRAAPGQTGTVYVTSVSGPKVYPFNPRYRHLMDKTGSGRQLFQVIHVDRNELTYRCYDATGRLFDAFGIKGSDT